MKRLPLPKPHHLVLVVGILVSLGTLASGIAPKITEWHDDSIISREPFGGIPDPVYWAFYVTAAVMLFVCAWLVSQRVKNYERGGPDDPRLRANGEPRAGRKGDAISPYDRMGPKGS